MLDDHVSDLLPAYALECLDDDDLLTVARHLSNCPKCCKELLTYQGAADKLGLSVQLKTPSSDLKDKVLRKVNLAGSVPAPRSLETPRPNIWNSLLAFFTGRGGWVFGSLALLLVVFFGLNNLWLGKENSDLRARVPANINIVNLQGTTNAPQSTGYLMVFKNENVGVLAVEDIPVLDTNHQYQLWLVRDGKRSNGGVFSVSQNGYGTLRIIADQPLNNFQSFGITVEPWGGSPQPTGKKVLGTNL